MTDQVRAAHLLIKHTGRYVWICFGYSRWPGLRSFVAFHSASAVAYFDALPLLFSLVFGAGTRLESTPSVVTAAFASFPF